MHRLTVKDSSEDRRHAKAIKKYIEREKWKKLKKYLTDENIHPGSILNARSRETGLHMACKLGQPEALRVLLKLGADPRVKDSRENTPLHYAIKFCLKNYSQTIVADLVQALMPHCADLLDDPNCKGTTCRRLLNGLKIKSDLENENFSHSDESSSFDHSDHEEKHHADEPDFHQKLNDLADEEYFESQGKFESYGGGQTEPSEESYNEWADRIFAEFRRKRFGTFEKSAKSSSAKEQQPQKRVLKLKLPSEDQTKKRQNSYLLKFKKLFESKETVTMQDLPFTADTTAEKIIETILWTDKKEEDERDSRNRLRDALRKWHPDKFGQLTQGRITDEEEKKRIFDVVTHISQALINYGK